jgi:hypothetical protein
MFAADQPRKMSDPSEDRASRRSVEAAGVAADLAPGFARAGIDGEIARAAVRAAIGSGGRCSSAPKAAHCDGPARDRRGRGSRVHSCSFWSRVSRAPLALGAASRPVPAPRPDSHHRAGALCGFLSGATAGAGWARTGGSPLRTEQMIACQSSAVKWPIRLSRRRTSCHARVTPPRRVCPRRFG